MNYATNFALVEDGVVTNVLWGMVYNTLEDFPNAVQTDDRAVQTGDTYTDGKFYHDGVEVLTLAEQITDMREALALLGVTDNG